MRVADGNMVHGLIIADNTYNDSLFYVGRATGAHKIASHLSNHGYNVEVMDYCTRWSLLEFQQLCNRLISDKTIFLGIGSNLFFDKPIVNEMLGWIKATYPNIAIIVGGNNLLYRDFDPVDYYVEGYAENSMLALLEYLEGRCTKHQIKWTLSALPKYLIDGNKDYGQVDTNDLTISYLPSDFISSSQVLGLETARGCIFKCNFCTYPLIGKKKLDYLRDPATIDRELRYNYDAYGITRYIIMEDTFNDSVHKLKELEKVISKLPFRIEFVTYARLDLILAFPETAEILKNIGMRGVHFGIETFNSKAAKLIGKPTDIEKIKDGLLWWNSITPGITTHCSMIVGLPEDDDDQWENLKWYHNSGIESYAFNPLYLTNLEKTVHTSEFSRNYEKYGLVKMTEEECQEELKIDDFSSRPWVAHQYKGLTSKLIFWKNTKTGDNYFRASRLAAEIIGSSKHRKVNCWLQFEYATLGYEIDECRDWGWYDVKPHVPEQELAQRAEILVNNYKKSKINYNYDSLYAK